MLDPSKHAPAWLTSADACQLPGCLAGSGPKGQGTRMDGPSHWHSHTQMAHSVSRLHIKMGGALMIGNDESAIFHLLPSPSTPVECMEGWEGGQCTLTGLRLFMVYQYSQVCFSLTRKFISDLANPEFKTLQCRNDSFYIWRPIKLTWTENNNWL